MDGGEHILLDAHLDEIGFAVTSIDKDGFLHLGKAGGPDMHVLLGHEVKVQAKEELYGVFCSKPPHLTTREDYKKSPEIDTVAVDIGMSQQRAKELVSPGDYVFLRQTPTTLLNNLVTGKAFDDRAGITSILRCLEIIKDKKPQVGVTAIFSLSEETGLMAVKAGAFSVAPTHAIVIDVSFGLAPDIPKEKCGELKKGPMIGISPMLSREVTDKLFELAEDKKIPYQTEVMPGGTGTNSDIVSISGIGIKTGLISIPLRNMHTAVEVVAPKDIENVAKLTAEYILSLGTESHCKGGLKECLNFLKN
jgi:endoglucanase